MYNLTDVGRFKLGSVMLGDRAIERGEESLEKTPIGEDSADSKYWANAIRTRELYMVY